MRGMVIYMNMENQAGWVKEMPRAAAVKGISNPSWLYSCFNEKMKSKISQPDFFVCLVTRHSLTMQNTEHSTRQCFAILRVVTFYFFEFSIHFYWCACVESDKAILYFCNYDLFICFEFSKMVLIINIAQIFSSHFQLDVNMSRDVNM